MDIILSHDLSINFVDCELPHLNQFSLCIYSDNYENKNLQIDGLIRKNPQIRSIELTGSTSHLVKVVSEVIPNIENLNLTIPDAGTENGPIRFGNVKILTIFSFDVSFENISFSHLEELRIFPQAQPKKLIEFFKRHQTINRLHLMNGLPEYQIQVDELTAKLPNLIAITVEDQDIDAQSISRLIESHEKLIKFIFSTRRFNDADKKLLKDRFDSEWRIKISPGEVKDDDGTVIASEKIIELEKRNQTTSVENLFV